VLKQGVHDIDLRTALGRWSTGHGGERCRSHALNSSHLEAQPQRAQAAKLSALGTRVRRSRNTNATTRHTLVVDFYMLRKPWIDSRKGFADPTLALSKTCPKVIRETSPLERRSRPVAGVHRPIMDGHSESVTIGCFDVQHGPWHRSGTERVPNASRSRHSGCRRCGTCKPARHGTRHLRHRPLSNAFS
jgi:hypothetical protein